LNDKQGEMTMFIPDVPDAPPQNVPVLIAQANQGQRGDSTTRTLGVCRVVPNGPQLVTPTMEYVLLPQFDAQDYLDLYEHRTVTGTPTVTILQQPQHGNMRLITEADGNAFASGRFDPTNPGYVYLPEKGYLGRDSATVLAEIGGIKVKVVYFFQTTDGGTVPESLADRLCGKKGSTWKISANLDHAGVSLITSVKYQSFTASTSSNTGIDSPT
jgi:hypothetical protein